MKGVNYFDTLSDRRKSKSGYQSTTEISAHGVRYYELKFTPEYKIRGANGQSDNVLVHYRNKAAECCVEKMCLLVIALNMKTQQISTGDTISANSNLASVRDTPNTLFVTRIIERINGSPEICSTIAGLTSLLDVLSRRFTRSIYHESQPDTDNKIALFNLLSDKMRENAYNPYSFYGYFSIKAEEGDKVPNFEIRVCTSLTQQGFEESCNTEMIRTGLLPVRNPELLTSAEGADISTESEKSNEAA